jgi:two-component system, sensor histidine kinase and response regulator
MGVESMPGHGATFWFTARFAPATAVLPAPVVARDDLHGVRVLIVDDNATNCEILHELCTAWGMQSCSAHDGQQALALLHTGVAQRRPYELAILDLQMPRMDGLALACAIKADAALSHMHLVLLTSGGGDRETQAAQQIGVACCLLKPVRPAHLYTKLTAVLSTAASLTDTLELPRAALAGPRSLSGQVLLAEDNLVNQEVALGMLESLGCQVSIATTGREAVETLEQQAFDVVLMDMQMPEMDGLTATRIIREREAHAGNTHTPIIALTANAFAQDHEACLAAGMDDYLSKPLTLEQLYAMLARWLPPRTVTLPAALPATADTRRTAGASDTPGTQTPSPPSPLDARTLDALRDLQQPDGPDIVGSVLRAYLESAPQLLVALREAVSQSDATTIQHAAHSLKSVSANVGATTLAAYCKELEAAGRTNTLSNAAAMLAHIEAEYAPVEVAITAELHVPHDLPAPTQSPLTPGVHPILPPTADIYIVCLADDEREESGGAG